MEPRPLRSEYEPCHCDESQAEGHPECGGCEEHEAALLEWLSVAPAKNSFTTADFCTTVNAPSAPAWKGWGFCSQCNEPIDGYEYCSSWCASAAWEEGRRNNTEKERVMIPPTVHRLPALTCISALQKCIRRGMEREAMEFAVELLHTSKPFCSMVCKRLEVICHEDLDCISQPWLVPFVHAATAQAREWFELPNPGKSRMALGNVIRVMCRARKSRQGDHFQSAIGWRSLLEGYAPEFPDWVHDGHTQKGRTLGRGLEFFRNESTRLVPPPAEPDPYEDEAYRMWALKVERERANGKGNFSAPGDEEESQPELPYPPTRK
jgi:hypothetical protein